MKVVNIRFGLILLAASATARLTAAELQPVTLAAWSGYIQRADLLMEARLGSQRPFLWTDEVAERSARLRRGEIVVAPVSGRGMQTVTNGLIHDWIGAAFIPNATLGDLLSVLRDYDRYKEVYKPVVANSKTIACSETEQQFSMSWQHRVLFLNAAMRAEYRAHDFVVDGRRGYNIADTTRVQEIEDFGQRGERLLAPDHGNGFIWRLHSIARYEARDGGVYLELEAIALTRDIPGSLRWLVDPVAKRLSISSLVTSLRQTRGAVNSLPRLQERFASCAIARGAPESAPSGAEK